MTPSTGLAAGCRTALAFAAFVALTPAPAAAQDDSLSQVLSFLLTNRAVQTGDFERAVRLRPARPPEERTRPSGDHRERDDD